MPKVKISRRYLAGLLDGEGYFGILPISQNRIYYKPVIKVALTEKHAYLLYEIRNQFGGWLEKRKFKNKNHNPSVCWSNPNFKSVKKILEYVYPFLILKKDAAKILLDFIKTKKEKASVNNKIDEITIAKRQRLYTLIKLQNSRGRPPAETNREPPVMQGEVIVRTSEKSEEVDRNINSTKGYIKEFLDKPTSKDLVSVC